MLHRPHRHVPVTVVLAILAALPLAGCDRGPGVGRARQDPPAAPDSGRVAAGDAAHADSAPAGTTTGAADTLVRYGTFRLANEDSLRALAHRR